MKTSIDFWKEHEGHEKKIPGKKFGQTPSISSGLTEWGTGRAECPLCGITETVIMDNRICTCAEYGQHVKIRCKKCGADGNTKNIDSIGARTLFIHHHGNCDCTDYEHICKEV